MAQQQSNKKETKSASTNDKYQSTFMPIFSDAEARIKRLIVFAFFVGMSKRMLQYQIMQIVLSVKKKIPADLHDRQAYINGLIKSANKLVHEREMATIKFDTFLKKNDLKRVVKTPQQFQELKISAGVKGSPQAEWYNKEIKNYIEKVSNTAITTDEKGKKPISLWQKAELDVRYEKNQNKLQEQIDNGVRFAFLSSHPDCSKRCEPWQGEMVSLVDHARAPQKKVGKDYRYNKASFKVGEIDGYVVYSLPDIMAVETPHGYNNNIIVGFNCRHYTIPYTPKSGQAAPKEYSKEDVKKQREIETSIRERERNIRSMKMQLNEYNSISGYDKEKKILKQRIKVATEQYKSYCNNNGYAWYEYRIKVNDNNIYLKERK